MTAVWEHISPGKPPSQSSSSEPWLSPALKSGFEGAYQGRHACRTLRTTASGFADLCRSVIGGSLFGPHGTSEHPTEGRAQDKCYERATLEALRATARSLVIPAAASTALRWVGAQPRYTLPDPMAAPT